MARTLGAELLNASPFHKCAVFFCVKTFTNIGHFCVKTFNLLSNEGLWRMVGELSKTRLDFLQVTISNVRLFANDQSNIRQMPHFCDI